MAKSKKERSGLVKFLRVLFVLVLVLVMAFGAYTQYVGVDNPAEGIISAVITPVQGLASRALAAVSDYMARLKLRSNIEYEYNQLKAQNDELILKALLYDEEVNKNERLTNMMGAYNTYADMNPILARVVASETGNWFSTFTIDVGTNDGVDTEMAVITSAGLIGHVYEVFATTAKVITIIDTNSSIAALIESSRDQGIVKGTLGVDGQPMCRMYYLPLDNVPRPGDSVITSGVGLPFPKGLLIGYVRESTRSLEENKHYIVVEPAADFQHIEEVLVLRYEPDVEEMPEGYNDDEMIIVSPPTARPQVTIDSSNIAATPVPLPDAPGRATATPSPDALTTPSPDGAEDGDVEFAVEQTATPEETAVPDETYFDEADEPFPDF